MKNIIAIFFISVVSCNMNYSIIIVVIVLLVMALGVFAFGLFGLLRERHIKLNGIETDAIVIDVLSTYFIGIHCYGYGYISSISFDDGH